MTLLLQERLTYLITFLSLSGWSSVSHIIKYLRLLSALLNCQAKISRREESKFVFISCELQFPKRQWHVPLLNMSVSILDFCMDLWYGYLLHFDCRIYIYMFLQYFPYVLNVDDKMCVTHAQPPGTGITQCVSYKSLSCLLNF